MFLCWTDIFTFLNLHFFVVFTRAFCVPKFHSDFGNFPKKIEDWDKDHVTSWLQTLGFGRYISGFASDFGGIGVDGDRLVYLGTEDQLDHIEYQLSMLGIENESDQSLLGDAIIQLVAVPEVNSHLLELLAKNIPNENRDIVDDYQI